MRRPHPVDTPIDDARVQAWLDEFGGYRVAVNRRRLDKWLDLFDVRDRDTAARLLDAIEYFGPERIATLYRQCLGALPGWNRSARRRTGRWFFVPMSSSAGDSGSTMVHHFRLATGMSGRRFDYLFPFPSELVSKALKSDDVVIFLDDFVGTGNQVTTRWNSGFSQLVAGAGTVYLMVVTAYSRGCDAVRDSTDLRVHFAHTLPDSDNLFGQGCQHFSDGEKQALLKYCKLASKSAPAGYGNCGLAVVFAHRCPNDSVPILHAVNTKWRGLFPRS